jgi:ubiquinone/menaquinone biosynthesis C-methylase UbiE
MKYLMAIINKFLSPIYRILYKTSFGRRFYWKLRSRNLYNLYGQQTGDFETLRNVLLHIKPLHLLDFGCGNGRYFQIYNELNIQDIVGIDISSNSLKYARKRNYSQIKLINCNINELNYASKYFDVIISNRVMQLIPYTNLLEIFPSIISLSNRIYINELSHQELNVILNHYNQSLEQFTKDCFYTFIHDYDAIFKMFDFVIEKEYFVNNQHRKLYTNKSILI